MKKLNQVKSSNMLNNEMTLEQINQFLASKAQHIQTAFKNRDYLSEYIWGKNQTITWIDSHKFRLEVEFANDEAARTFILRGGSNIYIEAPESLRNWACEEYLQAFQQY